jgi:hypothetical protein
MSFDCVVALAHFQLQLWEFPLPLILKGGREVVVLVKNFLYGFIIMKNALRFWQNKKSE